mmetsp:Transcript_28874/g.40238  ORF Transcript_28874/g.40238 Transcript_28874/m.40238 type:complete len:598 (-) Transcript_28874:315-2108(-)|eukprot:CAMPEP_0184480802 /NCGR_PEP_ID=MMETSP0113_2-20130426/2314_1 /TAXON_ID=91329 /ORGANISM="Norrisiella sphaerica, Strain BC52" /LENGTH=597 /DNA_ID=CAMNT_0026859525 /DNA_START=103 /DNA_END=1896 /DNA_ORIENTATION=-
MPIEETTALSSPIPEKKEGTKDWKIIPTINDVDEDLRAGKLIQQRVDDTVAMLEAIKAKFKSSSSILKFGIETFDSLANPIVVPIMSTVDKKVVGNVDPLISYAYVSARKVGADVYKIVDLDGDGKISFSEAYQAPVNIFQGMVVNKEWFDKVDEILNPSNITPGTLVARFNEAAAEAFKVTAATANAARLSIHKVTSDEFVSNMQRQMKDAWDEKLEGPAREFYAQAKAEYKRIDKDGDGVISAQELLDALQPVWEEKVVKVFQARIRPAVIAYKSILEVYTHYRKVAEEKGLQVSAEEFIDEVKTRLQDAYDERLAPYITEFYDGASKIMTEDLERIVRAMDMDGDSKLTLTDFVIMGQALLKKFVAEPYTAVLRNTMDTVNYVLPPPEEKEVDIKKVTDDLSLSLVTTTVSKRLVKKAISGLTDLKARAETLIGPDLIKYAEEILKDVHDNKLAPALKNLEEKLDEFKVFVSERVKPVQEAAKEVMESARAQELKKRFSLAIERAQGLAKDRMDYIMKRDLLLLPADMGRFFATTIGIKEKSEEYNKVVRMVSDLMIAILDVVKIVNWNERKVEEPDTLEEEAEEKLKLMADKK